VTLFAPSPNDTDGLTALGNFLAAVLPANTQIIQGQANRTPEPNGTEFVVMTAIRRARLATNFDTYSDVRFTASIAGATMTVTAVTLGAIQIGSIVNGPGVAAGTVVQSGPGGGPGAYTVTPSQTVASATLSAGSEQVLTETQITIQVDFHSADLATAGNMAETVVALLRSDFGVNNFAASNPGIVPLYCEDPRQLPFLNAEQQYETRWVVETILQMQQVLTIPEQFADSAKLTVIDVEAAYGP
jgi:hypothetical protein